jgi:peptidoglycan-N-acetylglucosamine deacetylase
VPSNPLVIVDPLKLPRVGKLQYNTTLPLKEKEIVLTFDDGPRPPFTKDVLDVLAAHQVKATFFLIGSTAKKFPGLTRRIYDDGHNIGTHTETHPLPFASLPEKAAHVEIEDGLASVAKVLGNPRCVAPFFRFPGLGRSSRLEDYLKSRSLLIWSADIVADDWLDITSQELVRRALIRLDERKRGILLLHDIQRKTARALPWLLHELKRRDYRFIHALSRSEAIAGACPFLPRLAPTAPTYFLWRSMISMPLPSASWK